jgi:molecular chaperone GrpE
MKIPIRKDKQQETPPGNRSGFGGPDLAPPAPETASETPDDADLATLQADLDRFRDLALRSQADLDNFRKRAAREKEDSIRFANQRLIEKLLPVFDSFELGLASAKAETRDSPILKGMEMVVRQLSDFLADNGVTRIDAEGAPFDPNLHEAIAQEASQSAAEGIVTRQIRPGYKLHDRLLRAANVIVSKGPAQ